MKYFRKVSNVDWSDVHKKWPETWDLQQLWFLDIAAKNNFYWDELNAGQKIQSMNLNFHTALALQ